MQRGITLIVIGLAAFVFVNGQDNATAQITDKLNEIVKSQGINITEIENGAVEAKKILEDKCKKNGGPGTFEKVLTAKDDFETCVKNLVNVSALSGEIQEARPKGDLDLVFKKYCDKKPVLEQCVTNFTDNLELCLEQREKENTKIVKNVTDSLLDFVCSKEGDRIALFVANGGPECFTAKHLEIQNCLNSTFGKDVPVPLATGTPPSLDNLPTFNFDTSTCTKMQTLEKCIVQHLEKCPDPTPGNMAESLFKFVRRATPCENILKAHASTRSAENKGLRSAGSTLMSFTLLVPIVSVLGLKFF